MQSPTCGTPHCRRGQSADGSRAALHTESLTAHADVSLDWGEGAAVPHRFVGDPRRVDHRPLIVSPKDGAEPEAVQHFFATCPHLVARVYIHATNLPAR